MASGVSELRLHDIVRLFGQTAADENVSAVHKHAQMRHCDPRMTGRYKMPAQARQAAEAVARRLGIVKPTKKSPRRAMDLIWGLLCPNCQRTTQCRGPTDLAIASSLTLSEVQMNVARPPFQGIRPLNPPPTATD